MAGANVRFGADLLPRGATTEEFAGANGLDLSNDVGNDDGSSAPQHLAGRDDAQWAVVVRALDGVLAHLGGRTLQGAAP